MLKGVQEVDVGEMDPQSVSAFTYAPVTSIEVETSFSLFKNCMSDRRKGFKFDSIACYFM